MTLEDFINDIPRDLARHAHLGTSHAPDDRADMERTEYATALAADYERLAAYATTDEKRGLLAAGFARYREDYKSRCFAYLSSRSRCLSPLITGPSRFPVGRNQKRNPTADRRFQDMVQFRRRTLDALRKALDPESHPIMAGDEDAVARLKAKLAEAEQRQVLMREVNAAIRRHAQEGEAAQARALIALNPKLDESDARELLFPDACGRVGFTAYQLANNNANIRRIKGRIALLSRDQATAPTTQRGDNGVLYEDCPADHRVRLFFPIIPPAEVRARLKNRTGSAGVRGCAAGRPAALPRPWSALSDSSLPPSNPSMPTAMKTPNPSAGRFGITSGALFGDRRTKSARGGIDHDVDSFSGQYLWTSLHRGGV